MTGDIWSSPRYKIRKKIFALANQYWIEDGQGNVLGYTRQKMLRLREDIRIYSDESMAHELFWINQEQVVDAWGTFAVVDSAANVCVGKIRRSIASSFLADEYFLLDPFGQTIGRVYEESGRGLLRKYVPLGGLVPERVKVELYGRQVAEIRQQFRVMGDEWDVDCTGMPPQFDRRVLLAGMILMGMIERERDGN